ncbi:RsmB/NOP family class I SAM-dependent RNA methyltransferase [bacterium]|nr:MAG: RsmB/NOP family class I SAM-dependent RNA methyltransferase [bacterium]
MKKSSLIGHILEVLELTRSQSRPADGVLAEFFRSRHYLGSKDRRAIAETFFGILRNYLLLENYVAAARNPAGPAIDVTAANPGELYGAYARVILKEDLPTIVADTASFWPESDRGVSPAQFLEAIDQITVPPAGADPVQRLAVVHSMPEPIVREWVERFGEEEAEQLCVASNTPAPVTIRVNTLRCSVEECQSLLQKEGIRTARTRFSPVGLTLEKRVNVQALHAFREGAFEMQDEGSQLLSLLLEPAPGSRVVDACAGAGGKTLHIAALMENKGSVLAIDTEQRRLEALRERARRAGVTIVQPGEPGGLRSERWREHADAVLIDAPCTGVGTFRRNPGAKMGFARQSLPAAAQRQLSILEEYSRMVKPGGRLVYATCSLLVEENEQVVGQFLRDQSEFHTVSASEILARQGVSLPSQSPFLTLLPHKTGTDGFFGAVFERE